MRGSDERTGALFSYVDLEARVRKDHPLRTIRLIVNETLAAMERDLAALYSGQVPTFHVEACDEIMPSMHRLPCGP